ncbi:uncharacterized protein AKAW2_21327A [Aspergillus luchuensis]|uniref:Uncharacterized protein n=1 Tax=Aspergillus kawachii TaxID=1069201 RepID=A0A7R7W4S2_ASPKA|nr:uncharacterized protein AKAW2_21327A [Aspergillus luchuensis]BCR96387.1 hypothetical protein AKAW2_21327A [Aspergillus luchuensis]
MALFLTSSLQPARTSITNGCSPFRESNASIYPPCVEGTNDPYYPWRSPRTLVSNMVFFPSRCPAVFRLGVHSYQIISGTHQLLTSHLPWVEIVRNPQWISKNGQNGFASMLLAGDQDNVQLSTLDGSSSEPIDYRAPSPVRPNMGLNWWEWYLKARGT